eukprot:TRINITY_DN5497_c0_g1_i10.p1 TRINITY_DN5497_c0_g1~~TRINITY_DN5497_c0_g1_i10.p1  ORF type:complete len:376 (-),score=67.64 TRINITY_DN5497_c0_g1_i10:495-1505(-)
MEGDHHDEHDHDEHEQGELLSCECMIDAASFSCNNSDMLNEAISFLKDNTDVCINECSKNDACASAFYVLTTFHDVCPILSGEEGSLFHDFGLHCEGCNADSLLSSQSGGLECSEVDCSDTADQNALVDLLIDCGPACEQFQETTCQQAWYALTAYHETCAEERLTVAVTSNYHDFEEVCPAACIPKDRPLPPKPDCAAEMMTMIPLFVKRLLGRLQQYILALSRISISYLKMSQVAASGVSIEQQPAAQTSQERVVTLKLVSSRKKKKAVKWAENVVDNELMNKKKSKKCCIFHKRRQFGDWSDDEDSDCDEDCCNHKSDEFQQQADSSGESSCV